MAVLMFCFRMQALTAPPNIPGFADQAIPGLQLAIATGASVYFLKENKKAGLGAPLGYICKEIIHGVSIESILFANNLIS